MIILTQEHADILTEQACSKSERTQDIKFFNLCADYDLQVKLQMATAAFLNPCYSWQEKTKPEDMPKKVACFLSQFSKDAEKVYDFLMTNPVLRILWKNHTD